MSEEDKKYLESLSDEELRELYEEIEADSYISACKEDW